MGRIPKMEKEKALEAVKSSDQSRMDDPYLHMGSDYDEYPRYSEPPTSYPSTSLTAYSSPMGPEIYDFDTGCISRQNHTIADDRERHFPETVTKPPYKGQRSLEEVIPLVQNEACVTIGNSQVKREYNAMETSSCHYSQHNNKNSSMEIHESSKAIDMTPFERHPDTYQYSNAPGVNVNTGNAFEAKSIFIKDQQCVSKDMFGMNDMFQSHPQHKTDVNRSHIQDQVTNMAENQGSSHNNTYQLEDRYPMTENCRQFGSSSQWCPSETGFFNQAEHINHSSSMATTMTLTSVPNKGSNPVADKSMNIPLHHENNHPKKMELENLHFKTEPIDVDFSDHFHNNEKEITGTLPQNKTDVTQNNRTTVPMDEDRSLATYLAPPSNVQETSINQLKLSVPAPDFSRTNRSPSVLSSSFPPTCPTPSSVDGSTTSSNRGRFSPGLIKVLLEQVLDSTQETDVALRLQQRLEQNRVNKGVVANVLNLIREVSAKRNKVTGSEETNLLSVESCSETSSLTESKMENIQRFLEDVNKFSRPEPLLSPPLRSPPFCQRQNTSYSIPDALNPALRYNCSPLKKRLLSGENFPNATICLQKSSSDMGQNKQNSKLYGTQSDKMGASCTLKNEQQINKYPLPEVNLTFCEQSKMVESSQHEEQSNISHNSPAACDLINQSIHENEVTCSDDKLSKEEVKKQVVQMTLEGLSFASKILNRMKPEHRERLRLWRNGLVSILRKENN